MAKFNSLKPIAAGLGLAVAATALTVSVNASAAQNPFATHSLNAGYMLASKAEGKCGDAKCGASMGMTEAQKTAMNDKAGDGKCGGDKAAPATKASKDGSCGASKSATDKASKDGSCGASKKSGDMKKTEEM